MERCSPLLSFSIYQSADERLVSPGEKKKTHKSGAREAIFTHRVKIEAGEAAAHFLLVSTSADTRG